MTGEISARELVSFLPESSKYGQTEKIATMAQNNATC
jgi:hypothetical protein